MAGISIGGEGATFDRNREVLKDTAVLGNIPYPDRDLGSVDI